MDNEPVAAKGGRAASAIFLDLLRVMLAQIRTSHADPEVCLTVERLRLDLATLEKDDRNP